jgi:uncharacterized membrane protein
MDQKSRRGAGRVEGASLKAMAGARRAAAGPDSQFTRRRHRLWAGLAQLLFVVAGLVAGIFVPKITVSPLVSSGKVVDLLFTAAVTVISLVMVIYSLLFLVVQWTSGNFSMRLALFRDDPIVWRAFAYAIELFVFCFTAAFAIGNEKTVSVIVPVLALVLVLGALVLIRVLQTRAFGSMLLAPPLTAITERGRETLDGLYPLAPAARPQPVDLPSHTRTVTWSGHPAVLQQLHRKPPVAAARAADSVVVFRRAVGATLLPGLPVADVHGGDPGEGAVLRAVVTGPERSFAQDPLLAFRLLADIALRALSPAVNDPATAVQAIDSLEGLLNLLASRTNRGDQLTDGVGAVRVILSLPRWEDFARSFLGDLIAAATDTAMVLLRLRELLARIGEQAPPAAGIVATRAAWVDDSLARKFPVIWADTATTGHGQLAEQPPGSR